MGLGLWALREIARVNHPIRSPSAFRPLTIEREREKERGEKGERKNRFLAGYGSRDLPTVCTPFYSAFIPSPPSALTPFFSFFFYFFSSAIPVRFLFSRFVLFFAPYEFRVSLVCSLSKAPPTSVLSFSVLIFLYSVPFFVPVSFLSPLIAGTLRRLLFYSKIKVEVGGDLKFYTQPIKIHVTRIFTFAYGQV